MNPKTRNNSLQGEEAWILELIMGCSWKSFEDGRNMFSLSRTFLPTSRNLPSEAVSGTCLFSSPRDRTHPPQ